MELQPSSIEFTRPGSSGAHPILLSAGVLRMAARAGKVTGQGANETSSATVVLNNQMRRTAAIIGRPLRAAVNIFGDDDSLLFTGLVAAIEYGRVITLTVDA
jgi:hypothetical protein